MLNKNIMHLHSEILKNFIVNINYQFFTKVNKKITMKCSKPQMIQT